MMDAQETRRLLELAAKAVGIEALGYEQTLGVRYVNGSEDSPFVDFWKPHLDDGDSRRLEVALKIYCRQYSLPVQIRGCWCRDGYVEAVRKDIEEREPVNGDPCAATRLAVLRAAAAIGESMVENDERKGHD